MLVTDNQRIADAYRRMMNGVNEDVPSANSDNGGYVSAKRKYYRIQLEISKARLMGVDRSRMNGLNAALDAARSRLEKEEAIKAEHEREEIEKRRRSVVNRNSAVRKSRGLYELDGNGGMLEIGGDAADYANRRYGSLDGSIKADDGAVE